MNVAICYTLVDFDGTPLQLNGAPVDLPGVIKEALVSEQPDEGVSGNEKLARWLLATRVAACTDTMEMTAEELALVKGRVAMFFPTQIAGQAWHLLETQPDPAQLPQMTYPDNTL